jgi:long-chain acyl-CoA synthetase
MVPSGAMSLLTRDLAAARPDAPALIDERGSITWSDLDRRIDHVGAALRGAGLVEGDVVAVMAGNQRETFELALACLQNGLLLVPVNWHLVSHELDYILRDSGARALVVDERWVDVAAKTATPEHAIVIGAQAPAGFVTWDDFLGGHHASDVEPVRGGVMFYTSGTTGQPKGVRGALAVTGGDAAMWQLLASSASMFSLPAEGACFLLAGPVYHSAQWVFSTFSLLSGATVVLQHKFDPLATLALIERHRVTNTHLVPTQFSRLLRLSEQERSRHDLSSLVAVHHGAAPCPSSVKRAMIEWWGPIVSEYYGGTEGGFISMISAPEWLERPGSVGRVIPIVEVFVTDDSGRRLGPNEPGQLWFKSLMGSSFEYHNAPEKTADAHLEPGVATLGDVGYFDDDGFLYLSDRKIDLIISGGVNIYPAEIEAVLTDHPAVDDAAVFGVPDDEFGESVMAVVEAPHAPPELTDELMAMCREHLAGFKCPRTIEVVDELPRSEAGKLQKRLLRDPHWAGFDRAI